MHTHQGNISTSLVRLAVAQMKERMSETSATLAAVLGTVSRRLDDRSLQANLPKRHTLTRVYCLTLVWLFYVFVFNCRVIICPCVYLTCV